VLVAATAKGICKIGFGDDPIALASELRGEFANAELVEDAERLAPFIAQVDAYLHGTRQRFDLPLDIAATAFRQRVWDALRRIPYGETRSYSDIAEAVGSPRAVRAVASACASNPVALAIPCHRVVQKGGALAGYRWGLPRKAALLDAEALHAGVVEGVETGVGAAMKAKATPTANTSATSTAAGKRKAKPTAAVTPNLDHAA
jgi:AraC family transcriptional regulator of adaptative response/methylated-DNA-[protein]-cysteine methyltransferase